MKRSKHLRDTPYDDQQKLDTPEKQLLGPLTWLGRLEQPGQVTEVRIVVDALDRFATGARGSVVETLNQLGKLAFVHLLVTARPDMELPLEASSYSLAFAPDKKIHQYLERRSVLPARQAEFIQAAQGSWLVARVLADLLGEQPEPPIGAGRLALGDAYEEMLSRCVASDDDSPGVCSRFWPPPGRAPCCRSRCYARKNGMALSRYEADLII